MTLRCIWYKPPRYYLGRCEEGRLLTQHTGIKLAIGGFKWESHDQIKTRVTLFSIVKHRRMMKTCHQYDRAFLLHYNMSASLPF